MDARWAMPDLERTVYRWRRAVYALATAGMLVVLVIGPDWRAASAVVVFLVSLVLSLRLSQIPMRWLLLWDLGVSLCVWWLYGPISGAAFIALGVVAVGPFLIDKGRSRLLLVAALVTIPIEIVFHFLAGEVNLPLFHPQGPVPNSEFLTGQAIQGALIVGVGVLMIGVAQMLRRGQSALAADLDRERELSALKDRFVATVSHELRTPLTSLKGFTTTLLENDLNPSERHEFLTIMSDQAEELHGLIEDLITFSRIGAGALTITSGEVDLHQLTDSVLAGFGARGSGVTNNVPSGSLVLADAPRVRQVLRNLVDNALKYGKQPVFVTALRETGQTRCLVLDGGNGIDPARAHLVFEPYARLVDDLTMSSPGLGLGLPIVRELVEAHGGEVHIVTRNGFSGFEFTLPSPNARDTSAKADATFDAAFHA